jgi:hypothetical protein
LRTDPPEEGADYVARPVSGAEIDLNTSSLHEIEDYFRSLSRMDVVVYEQLRDWLTAAQPPPPLRPG